MKRGRDQTPAAGKTSQVAQQRQRKRQKSLTDTQAANQLIFGQRRDRPQEQSLRYRTDHRMIGAGFFVFTLESPAFPNQCFSENLARKFQTSLEKVRKWDKLEKMGHGITGEDHRLQILGSDFEALLETSPIEFQLLTVSLKAEIQKALMLSDDRIRASLEEFPTLLLNSGPTEVQDAHIDWTLNSTGRYSVIMAITETELIIALGQKPTQTSGKNFAEVQERVRMHSLQLSPGEIICFHGRLIHAGGRNKRGALRLHWYASKNIANDGVPDDEVVFAPKVVIPRPRDMPQIAKH